MFYNIYLLMVRLSPECVLAFTKRKIGDWFKFKAGQAFEI
jgi:hypothetical protein